MDRIRATYRIRCPPDAVEAISREIALEQTVEVPERFVASTPIMEEIVGRVESIDAARSAPDASDAVISYASDLACSQISALLNLVYGNVSIKKDIRLVGLELPESFLNEFKGPSLGIEGIRRLIGVWGRPLLASVLKPRGSTNKEFASIAGAFASAGGDIIKDDHNLLDRSFDEFRDRVLHCAEAVRNANERTGRRTLYFPNLMAPVEEMERRIEFLLHEGIHGALLSPLAIGLDWVRRLAESYPLIVMGHPTFSGAYYHDDAHGIDPGVLLGTLFRLVGCDASIYPNEGGRFQLTREECLAIGGKLREPLGSLKPAFPVPAGGMSLERIPAMADAYGDDAIYLIGSALLGHSDDVRRGTEAYLDKIRESFTERLESPESDHVSTCEIPSGDNGSSVLELLKFGGEFSWQGREPTVYKNSEALPFRDVTRHELLGGNGERTAFHLRYFEIAPGGYTSLEKHLHAHAIICIRGNGVLVRNDEHESLKRFDIAYVRPMDTHQLRNETDEPFGFFCIVDGQRDKPMKP